MAKWINNNENQYDYSEIARKYGYNTFSKSDIKKYYLSWKKGLSKKEIVCLFLYRLSSSRINRFIREDWKNLKPQGIKKIIAKIEYNIYTSIDKGTIDRNIAVYRRLAQKESDFWSKKKIGDIITGEKEYKGYKGTHVDKRIKSHYCHLNLPKSFLIILVPKGTRCAYINYWVAIFSMEHELLLNKNLVYTLKERTILFGVPLFVIEII